MNIDTAIITRLEVVDDQGRALTLWNTQVMLSVQDDGKTLKAFVKGTASTRQDFGKPTK